MDTRPRASGSSGDMVNEHSFILHNSPQDGKDFREPVGNGMLTARIAVAKA
jgi:hypothetical protein